MGPVTQILFVESIRIFNIYVPTYFYTYHMFILFFNLLPIYPLDGGKLISIVTSFIFSYYLSLKITLYFSYFLYFLITFYLFFTNRNLSIILIILLLGKNLLFELNKCSFMFKKFLLERYLNNYKFKRKRIIKNTKEMKRDYYHYLIVNNELKAEKNFIKNILNSNIM